MKKLLLTVLVVLGSCFGFITEIKASHFAGADLSYVCLGGNTYQVTLSFYRDCSGIAAPNPAKIKFTCQSNNNFTFETDFFMIVGTGNEITPSCSANPSSCAGGSMYGIAEYVYQGIVTLPPCSSWDINWASNARNPISTISGQPSWYVPALLDNRLAPCNSSPTFSNKPIAVACIGQKFCFNHGAIDADGDSLSYAFYAPKTSATTAVNYLMGYSATNFISSSTPITLDPVTGDICFTPNAIQNTVTGIEVTEWREINGIMKPIGKVYRDIQMKVVACNNKIPILSGMDTNLTATYNPADTTYYIEKCLDINPIKFHINGHDDDVYDPTNVGSPHIFSIKWNRGIPGASFIPYNNGTDSAYAEFTWMPTSDDVGTVPRCFTATIMDEACPYYGMQTFSYCIVVRGMLVDIGSDTLLCDGESARITAVADTTTINYIWKVNGVDAQVPTSQEYFDFESIKTGPGKYLVSVETNDGTTTTKCPGVDAIIVDVTQQPKINGTLNDSAFCDPGSVTYDAGPGILYSWTSISAGGLPVGADTTYTVSSSGIYRVEVDGGHYTRCTDVDTFQVVSIRKPKLSDDTCIWTTSSPYTIDAGFIDPGNIYTWSTGEDTKTIEVDKSGTYSVTVSHLKVSPDVGCSDSQVVNVINEDSVIVSRLYMASENKPMPGEEWQTGDIEICTYQRVRMKGPDAPSGHSYVYEWKKGSSVVSNIESYFFQETSVGDYTITLNVGGCVSSVNIEAENCDVEVPNVITPNGDGANDYFRIVIKGSDKGFYESFPSSTLIIMNRWGKIVYESNNYQNNWNGDNLSDGTYFWVLRLADGKETEMSGTVTILRE